MIVALKKSWIRFGIYGALFFLILTFLVLFGLTNKFDVSFSVWLSSLTSTFGNIFMWLISFFGSSKMILLYSIILSAVLWFSRLKIPSIWVMSTIISGFLVATIIKLIVRRQRPVGHLNSDDGFSYPSGHSFGTWMFIWIIFILIVPNISNRTVKNWVSYGMITFGLLLMESRVYLKAHYLTDTLGGASLAIAWVTLCVLLYRKYASNLADGIDFLHGEEI